jgi:hypothetical protein
MKYRKGIVIGLWITIVASAIGYLTTSMMIIGEPNFKLGDVLSFVCIFNTLMGLCGLIVLDMKKKAVS